MNCAQTSVPPRISAVPNRSVVGWLLLAGVAAVCGCVLFFFNPQEHGFYPLCFFHSATGLLCPGCGCLRATHELLHGDFVAAFRFNPLYVTALPVIGYCIWQSARRRKRGLPARPVSSWIIWACLVIVVVFGILRNVPGVREFAAFAP